MTEVEVGAHWAAVLAYALATLTAGLGVVFAQRRLSSVSAALLAVGSTPHMLALGLRWSATGHGPYLGRYEAFSSHALTIVVVWLVLSRRWSAVRPGSIVIGPAALLLLGAAVLAPASPTYPSPALDSPWLHLHVSIAKLALATTLASTVAGLVLLAHVRGSRWDPAVPGDWKGLAVLDVLAHRLVAYTFFLMSVVLLSGALWAQAAWGAYWSWDPVETWALAFWSACALVLHARGAGGWAGPRWGMAVVALGLLGIVSFIGYGHFGVSVHAAYVAP